MFKLDEFTESESDYYDSFRKKCNLTRFSYRTVPLDFRDKTGLRCKCSAWLPTHLYDPSSKKIMQNDELADSDSRVVLVFMGAKASSNNYRQAEAALLRDIRIAILWHKLVEPYYPPNVVYGYPNNDRTNQKQSIDSVTQQGYEIKGVTANIVFHILEVHKCQETFPNGHS